MSVHGLLAADLALDASGRYGEWNAVLPTPEDVQSMPFTWPHELQQLLPFGAAELLRKQKIKFARDWEAVSAAGFMMPKPRTTEKEGVQQRQQNGAQEQQPLDLDHYRYAWLLINTRTFYFVDSRTEKLPREDRMVLQPVADLFNHADKGCPVTFGPEEFTIRSDRAIGPGEELAICYGNHSNDCLLAEYGFVLEPNRFDEVRLDDVLLPRLSAAQKDLLGSRDFLGNYVLDADTVCYRTEVALRLMSHFGSADFAASPLGAVAAWETFVDGLDEEQAGGGRGAAQHQQAKADGILLSLLAKHRLEVRRKITSLEGPELVHVGTAAQRELLATRWRQIDCLFEGAIQRLEIALNET